MCIPAQAQVEFLNGAMGAGFAVDDVLAIGGRIANLRVGLPDRDVV